ncbi:hypothetical protein [Saccharolobus solfataricus]|uniref:Uncharacterized protein n=2 Tax=Saccharolobus solfataricus TaxID=2287 RepID=A0A157T2W7_SACSO|nr:hypothetical protein [Saccharolobus solfataricus]QPG48829.1 hypothetical protein HFC64_01585 [Saccharolobus solfataricus]SAI85238.1 uncharacterised protein [Saccharolobus solfataricus]
MIKNHGGDCKLYIIPEMKHTPLGQQYHVIWNAIKNWIKRKVLRRYYVNS